MLVAIKKADSKSLFETIKDCVDLTGGFCGITDQEAVLIKPNIVGANRKIPWFGSVTNPSVIEALVHLLFDLRIDPSRIYIGEGSCIGLNTRRCFKDLGLVKLAKKYKINLVDFDEGPFRHVTLGKTTVEVHEMAFNEQLYIINLPVMHTHIQVGLSCAIKNHKGFLSEQSKRIFHKRGLNDLLVQLLEEIEADFSIVDGTYSMSQGPSPIGGIAHKTDLIVAGASSIACDLTVCELMDLDVSSIEHIKESARRKKFWIEECNKTNGIDVKGESIEALKSELSVIDWKTRKRREKYLEDRGINGIVITADDTACSGCIGVNLNYHIVPLTLFKNRKYDIEIVAGKTISRTNAAVKIFYGDCATTINKNDNGHYVRGCPPHRIECPPIFYECLSSKYQRWIALLISNLVMKGLGKPQIEYWKNYKGWK